MHHILRKSSYHVALHNHGQSGDYMYTKKLEKDKIDPTVALTMALEMAVSDEV